MQTLGSNALITAGVGVYAWLVLRRLGVGHPDSKPDCGCGSGKACKGKVQS